MAKPVTRNFVPLTAEISADAAAALKAAAAREGVEPEILAGRILESACRSTSAPTRPARALKSRPKKT